MKTKGVSLIVLIITIIILSILVAVTIITLKNTGIIKDAEDAVDDLELPQVQELASFAWGEARIKGLKTSKEIKEYVIAEIKKVFSEEILAKYDIEVTKKKVVVSLAGQGGSGDDVAGGGTTPEPYLPENSLVAMYKAGILKQGDYVNYTPSPADSWTLTSNVDGADTCVPADVFYDKSAISQEGLNWRVLGYDEENNELLLIAGSPTVSGIYVEYTTLGYNNCINALDSTCRALYSNTTLGAVARSININDLDTYLGGNAYDKTTYGNEVDGNGNVTSINPGGYGYTSDTLYSEYYVDENSGNIMKGDVEKKFSNSSTAYAFDFKDIITDETILEILSGPNGDYLYWLASRNIQVNSDDSVYCCKMIFDSTSIRKNGSERIFVINKPENMYTQLVDNLPTTFRPVVVLPARVTTDDVPLVQIAPKEKWVYPYQDDGELDI